MNVDPASAPTGRRVKSEAAFRTISEVSEQLDVPQHVLRFWESRFAQVKPLKRGGGRRYYRPADIQLLRRIRDLLYRDGYTIKGVQKLLKDGGIKAVDEPEAAGAEPTSVEAEPAAPTTAPETREAPVAEPAAEPVGSDRRAELRAVLDELVAIRALLRNPPI